MKRLVRMVCSCAFGLYLSLHLASAQVDAPQLADADIQRALEAGHAAKNLLPILSKTNLFSIRLMTPFSYIGGLAGLKAQKYERLALAELSAEQKTDYLLIFAEPATPTRFTQSELARASSVRRVVLTEVKGDMVVKASVERSDAVSLSTAAGAKASYNRITAKFDMRMVRALMGAKEGFVVVVVGEPHVGERRFEIKRAEFDALPSF